MCSPGLTIDTFLEAANPGVGPVFEAVMQRLEGVQGDPVIVDPVSTAILLKNGPVFCTIRSMKKWTAVGFTLKRKLDSTRISRKVSEYQSSFYHVVNVFDSEEIDAEFGEWLVEAYYRGAPAIGSDPMVPDDVDDFFDDPS